MKKHKNVINLRFIAACVMLAASSAYTAGDNKLTDKLTEYYPVLSDYMHYSIGGGSAVSAPASRGTPNQYGLGIGWKSNFTCGNFDMKFSIKNQLNGITEGFKDLYGNIIESATGAVASLPAMIIQRANPQLYDMLSNGLYQGKLDFNNFKTSCEAMSNQLADLAMDSKWAKMAGLQDAAKIAENETDAMAARKKIDEDSKKKGEKGIVWVGGETKGGKNQKPIEIIGDVVGAGYNIAIGRQPTAKGQVVNCDGMLCLEWDTPEKAAAYAKELLGEKILRTCTTCGDPAVESKAGKGLNAFIEKSTIEKATQLEEAINNMSELTPKQLNAMGTSTVAVTQGVLDAIASSPDAAILGARLANELAISKELEKAIGLRRMLLAGMREPNVENNPEAQTDIEKALKLLDREIEQVKLEMELQRSINGNTALAAITQQMNEQMLAVDDNSLGDGNRRFANLSREAGSNNITGNVNGATSQAVRTRYIAIPRSDGTGMSDFFGTYKASLTNIISNVNVGNYNQIAQVNGNAAEQATALLKQFEGYLSHGKWDVNANRAGYGSDTYTTADGKVHKVEKGTYVSREDAERDLARRMPQFMNTARRDVGAENWSKLTPQAQAVLTSVSYNYGSLSKLESVQKAAAISAQSGDMTALADSIRKLQGHNNGINARRRNQEADYILNTQKGT